MEAFQAALASIRKAKDEEIATLRELLARSIVLIDGFRAERDRAQQALTGERTRVEELRAGQVLMIDMHARELAATRAHLERVRDAAEALRQADEERRASGLLARLRAAWRGE
jgi:hypothetical protein